MTTGPLRRLLELVEPDRELWHLPGGRTVRAAGITRMLADLAPLAGRAAGRRVALLARSECELVPLLVLLDGTCAQLTLLPENQSRDQLSRIVARSDSELLVTTDPALGDFGTCATVHVPAASIWATEPWADASRTDASPAETPTRSRGGYGELVTRWVLPTSGTTGEPKLVAHTLPSLTRTVKQDLARGQQYRWGSLYRLTGFAGLQVFMQSWWGGSCLILSDEEGGSTIQRRVEQLIAGRCTAISATPTMWRKLLMSCPVDQLPLRRITLGGEVADQAILDALRRAFPTARIAHVYASTEAGVGWGVHDGRAGFPAALLHSPPPGIQLAIDAFGHLLVRSECDEQTYLNSSQPLAGPDGFIDTGDLVACDGDRVYFLGRENGTINVGGNKVHPEQVERVLLSFPGVRLARASARRSSLIGSLVQAEVVVDGDRLAEPELLRSELIAHCRAQLEPYQVPAFVKFVTSIELTDTGKLKRED